MTVKCLQGHWDNVDTIVLYGLGLVAERIGSKLIQDFKVPYIIDNNKKGSIYHGIKVVSYEEVREVIKEFNLKIVVTTSQRVYGNIKRSLEMDDLVENRDFCKAETFAVEWYWNNREQINVIQINTAITTACTLKCKNCNMFMPYYKEKTVYSFETLKKDIDLLLEYVDYIFCLMILGGEPFLNKDLGKYIEYVAQTYEKKIGRINITTNGTVLPNQDTLDVLRRYNVNVVISDYTNAISYEGKLRKFREVLETNNIAYMLNQSLEWLEFGFPENPFDWGNKEQVKKHMQCCSPLFHGYNDGKLYYCHVIWSAEKAGLFQNHEEDYIDIAKLSPDSIVDRKRLSEYSMGLWEKGYLDFCRFCGGCGTDNKRFVQVAEQCK